MLFAGVLQYSLLYPQNWCVDPRDMSLRGLYNLILIVISSARERISITLKILAYIYYSFSPQISAYFYLPSNHLIIPLLGNLWAVRNSLSALHLSMHYRKELEKCWLQLYFQLIFLGLICQILLNLIGIASDGVKVLFVESRSWRTTMTNYATLK